MVPPDDSRKMRQPEDSGVRKNRTTRTRRTDWTQQFHQQDLSEDMARTERVSGKGELARRRTVTGELQTSADGATFERGAGRRRGGLPARAGAERAGPGQHRRRRTTRRSGGARRGDCSRR